jgi:hypothetical protein
MNAATIQAVKNEEFKMLEDLLDIAEDQIDKLVKLFGSWQDAAATNNTNFPFMCIQRLKARVHQGIINWNPDEFMLAICKTSLRRLQEEEKEINDALEDRVAPLTPINNYFLITI